MSQTDDGMLPWIVVSCRLVRESSRTRLQDVAQHASRDKSSLFRFEDGQTGYPRALDLYVRAYADKCGMRSPRDLWIQALLGWHLNTRGEISESGALEALQTLEHHLHQP